MEIKGLDYDKIKKISEYKGESKDVLDFRLKSFDVFKKLDEPNFGPSLDIIYDDIMYY